MSARGGGSAQGRHFDEPARNDVSLWRAWCEAWRDVLVELLPPATNLRRLWRGLGVIVEVCVLFGALGMMLAWGGRPWP